MMLPQNKPDAYRDVLSMFSGREVTELASAAACLSTANRCTERGKGVRSAPWAKCCDAPRTARRSTPGRLSFGARPPMPERARSRDALSRDCRHHLLATEELSVALRSLRLLQAKRSSRSWSPRARGDMLLTGKATSCLAMKANFIRSPSRGGWPLLQNNRAPS